jgi:predicted transcriptional regulator
MNVPHNINATILIIKSFMKVGGVGMSENLFIRFELFDSKAFKSLSMGQFRIYFKLASQIKSTKTKVRKRWKYVEDNPNIKYPMRKMAKDEGVHLSTVQKAISKLTEVGFIDIVHRGAAYEGDQNIYHLSDRWKLYGTPSFVNSKAAYSRMRGWRAYHMRNKKEACNPPPNGDSKMEQKQTKKKLLVIRNKSKVVMPDRIQPVSEKSYSR